MYHSAFIDIRRAVVIIHGRVHSNQESAKVLGMPQKCLMVLVVPKPKLFEHFVLYFELGDFAT